MNLHFKDGMVSKWEKSIGLSQNKKEEKHRKEKEIQRKDKENTKTMYKKREKCKIRTRPS